jgi:hypothetical protein
MSLGSSSADAFSPADNTNKGINPASPALIVRKNVQTKSELVKNSDTETNSIIDISGACLYHGKRTYENEGSLFQTMMLLPLRLLVCLRLPQCVC